MGHCTYAVNTYQIIHNSFDSMNFNSETKNFGFPFQMPDDFFGGRPVVFTTSNNCMGALSFFSPFSQVWTFKKLLSIFFCETQISKWYKLQLICGRTERRGGNYVFNCYDFYSGPFSLLSLRAQIKSKSKQSRKLLVGWLMASVKFASVCPGTTIFRWT